MAGGVSAAKVVVFHDHFAIRQFARDAMYDSTVARAMVIRFADTVVEAGLKLKPTPDPQLLKITPEVAEAWAENVATRFHIWASSKKSHAIRVNNFYQNQHLYQFFMQRDGDVFARFYYSKEKDNYNPLQIDFLDPNQIRGYSYTSTYSQLPIEDGIIRDEKGRETGYKIWRWNKEQNKYEDIDIPRCGEKSGRVFVIHGFKPEYAGQGRGYSGLAHALQEFEKITDFSLSTIQKAIVQSSFTMAIENDIKDPSNPLESRFAGPVPTYGTPPDPGTQGQQVLKSALEPVVNYQPMKEATITEPGQTGIFNLRRGDKIKNLQDTSPSASFDTFMTTFCSFLCASKGMPIELLLMKFNNSFSASRAALILFWRVAQMERDEMKADFLDPVYEMWLSEEIAAGRIQAPGWNDPFIRDAWLQNEWAGCAMPNIDPQKTAAADLAYVSMGAQTLDDVARNFNGSSGKANRSKLKRQWDELPKPGLPVAPIIESPKEEEENKNG